MASIEVATAPAGLIASEEDVKAVEEAVKAMCIERTTEKATEIEAPASSTVEEVPVVEQTVDESPGNGEKFAEVLTATPPASELLSEDVAKQKEKAAQVAKEAEPTKEEFVTQAPAETLAVDEKTEEPSAKEETPADVETVAEEKAEESSAKEEVAAEIPEEKTASIEERAVEKTKLAEAAPAEEETEGEGKAEE